MESSVITRRSFASALAVGAVGAIAAGALSGCSTEDDENNDTVFYAKEQWPTHRCCGGVTGCRIG